jgi:ParB family transcriptional regulator, chromosome partitioning protein
MADYWVADEAFYSLIRDREVLTEILRDVGRDAAANAHAGAKGKTIKGVIGDFLTGEGRTKRDKWVPRWMAFPPSAYTPRGGVATVAAATRAPQAIDEDGDGPRDPDPQAAAMLPASESDEEEEKEALEEVEAERLAA